MKSKEEEYRELFLSEALENFEQLDKLFIDLEKDHGNKHVIANIFRIIHTIKGNALGMGYDSIADLAHVIEDVFDAIKNNKVALDSEIVNSLFRANDKLGALINSLNSKEKVSYLGIKTKLAIFLKNARKEPGGKKDSDTVEQIEEQKDKSISFAEVLQIPVKKMDKLLNMVGELVIERDRLISHFGKNAQITFEFEGLKRISSNLHHEIMSARMVQMSFLFNKFHRVLRDVAVFEQKEVKLHLKGTEIEIDRNILKIISDSLVHIVRNAVSHGIENKEDRAKTDKPKIATVTLEANLEKENVVLSISDDGRGINPAKIKKKIVEKKLVTKEAAKQLTDQDVIRYIFEPGFSSADKVTEISGRGVGMDVVKRSVESIGGQVLIDTNIGKGSSFHLMLPSSLTLKGSLLFELDKQEYAIPLTYIESVNYFNKKDIHNVSNSLMVNYNDHSVSLIFLEYLFKVRKITPVTSSRLFNEKLKNFSADKQIDVIIAQHSGRKIGLVVDKLLRQKEIIEKKLPKPLDTNKFLSGSTILGSGRVCPVIDVASIMDFFYKAPIKAPTV